MNEHGWFGRKDKFELCCSLMSTFLHRKNPVEYFCCLIQPVDSIALNIAMIDSVKDQQEQCFFFEVGA